MREDEGEIEIASAGKLTQPIELADIRGMTHCHTVYSDGRNSIEEMALAAEAMGMTYLTITDHSPSAHYARGVGIDRLQGAVGRDRAGAAARQDKASERDRIGYP